MPKKLKITFAESAIQDLEDVLHFYEENQMPHIGKKIISAVLNDIILLEMQPDLGRVVTEFDQPFLRELIRPPFRIVYRRDQQKIRIIRIWKSERLLKI